MSQDEIRNLCGETKTKKFVDCNHLDIGRSTEEKKTIQCVRTKNIEIQRKGTGNKSF